MNERSVQQAAIHPGYKRVSPGSQPEYLSPEYRSSVLRAPAEPLIVIPHTLSELSGPVFGHRTVRPSDADLTIQHRGEPLGERILVYGRVIDDDGRPVPNALLEIWQANAAGRYLHRLDQHAAPIDPNFSGAGRLLTDPEGRFEFKTIKPGAYPWGNHFNAWRPAHIHFSLFGAGILSRLVTQMYFPGDPLLNFDPIYNSISDERARNRLISSFDLERTLPGHALAYHFDIVLRGHNSTYFE